MKKNVEIDVNWTDEECNIVNDIIENGHSSVLTKIGEASYCKGHHTGYYWGTFAAGLTLIGSVVICRVVDKIKRHN